MITILCITEQGYQTHAHGVIKNQIISETSTSQVSHDDVPPSMHNMYSNEEGGNSPRTGRIRPLQRDWIWAAETNQG